MRCSDDHFEQRFNLVLGKVDVNVDMMGHHRKDKHARGGSPACAPAVERVPLHLQVLLNACASSPMGWNWSDADLDPRCGQD